MSKLNNNETTAYATTILQERNEALFEALEQLAYDTMDACGVPETDLDTDVHTDFMSGLLEKLVCRLATGEWPDAQFGDEIESCIDTTPRLN